MKKMALVVLTLLVRPWASLSRWLAYLQIQVLPFSPLGKSRYSSGSLFSLLKTEFANGITWWLERML